jgi:menaquinone-dependent protoporphyrinogen oxidase
MSRILVLYSTYDGQAERIAARVHEVLVRAGHQATLRRFDGIGACEEIRLHDAVMVGAAVRYGHHDRRLVKALRWHAADLAARPNAVFSVCLSAGGPGHKPAEAQRYLNAVPRETGWTPDETVSFAGALPYTRYNPFIRLLMRLIVGSAGGDTDTSRDYDYTDWVAVERFAQRFAARLAPRAAA